MPRKIALVGGAICLVLIASTQAWSAARSANPPRGEAVREETMTRPQTGAVTIRQLLLGRLDWSLRVSRALLALEQPDASQSTGGNSPNTIIDEPDPAGMTDDDKSGGSGERPHPIDGDDPHDDDDGSEDVPLSDAATVP